MWEDLNIIFLAVFKHHDYSFGQDVRLQQEGAPIGLKISGAVGKVVMVAWVRRFKARMTLAAAQVAGAWSERQKMFHGGSFLKLADDNMDIQNPEAQNLEMSGF